MHIMHVQCNMTYTQPINNNFIYHFDKDNTTMNIKHNKNINMECRLYFSFFCFNFIVSKILHFVGRYYYYYFHDKWQFKFKQVTHCLKVFWYINDKIQFSQTKISLIKTYKNVSILICCWSYCFFKIIMFINKFLMNV